MDQQARRDHWEEFYATHPEQDLSWYESEPALSLEMIRKCVRSLRDSIIDIGGGSSRLVDCLVADGYHAITVLDICSRALKMARVRLGDKAHGVQWIESDVLGWNCTSRFDIWHDRATYHFLTEAKDRQAYAVLATRAIKKGGALIVANFAVDGPRSCSGLPTYQASAQMIATDFGPSFALEESRLHEHLTPRGNKQRFQICLLRRG